MELDHIIARNLMQGRMHPTLNGIEVQTALTWRSRNCDLENWVTFALNRLDRLRREIEASVEHQNLSLNSGCDVYCLHRIDVHRGMVDRPEREIVTSETIEELIKRHQCVSTLKSVRESSWYFTMNELCTCNRRGYDSSYI